ncbi:MAG: hypothetical protein HQ538_03630 [Parcubacteria group bacterium]|nr:hypothetical protein [Parcubacteria group bacterium]
MVKITKKPGAGISKKERKINLAEIGCALKKQANWRILHCQGKTNKKPKSRRIN